MGRPLKTHPTKAATARPPPTPNAAAARANRIGAECRAFEEAGRGKGTARSLTEARARIETHEEAPGRQPMGHWLDALHSIEERAESRAMLQRLEAVMGATR